jgi:prophage regulatory protein
MLRSRRPTTGLHSPSSAVKRILSPQEVIELTGLSSATLWRLRRRKELPEPIRLSPGRIGWRESDIERWLDARERQATEHGK